LREPEFQVKPKFAPWVDALIRFAGPIARQNQYIFIADWMTYVSEDIRSLLEKPIAEGGEGFPARNDSWQVAAASHSYYRQLAQAGVRIHEFVGGLLHTKSMTIDDDVTLIGSANMDRRSFDLNYENNILLCDARLTHIVRERQEQYLASSRPVHLDDIEGWSIVRRFWNNLMGMLGPVL
jgi:phosphatidylserine/phosphatidylglycerophosphate/cardiolipin synthase-like enzyme